MRTRYPFIQRIYNLLVPEIKGLQELRERILKVLSYLVVIIGAPMLILNIPAFVRGKNWVFLAITIIGFVLILTLTISLMAEKTPYRIKVGSLIIFAFFFGLFSFETYGLVGDARIWLLFLSIFTTIMLGLRMAIFANLLAIGTYIIVGTLILNGSLVIRGTLGLDYSLSSESWITAGATFAFVSVVLSISTGLLLRGLETNLHRLEQSFEETHNLSTKLEEEHDELVNRSEDLERRLVQIRTAAEISRTLGTILDPNELLQQVATLIHDRFNLYYVGVFLSDESNRYANLAAGTGEAGAAMIADRHRLTIGGSSMVGWATAHGQPRISLDVEQEAIRFRNPHLPLTRSELALPLAIGNQIIGAISMQSTEPQAFDEDDIVVLQSITDSLAIALENARLFQQFEQSIKEIQQLNRQYMSDSWVNIWAENKTKLTAEDGLNDDDFNEVNIPLVLRGDQVIGNITLSTDQAELTSDENELVQAISNQAALALESARLLDEANRRVEQERALRDLTNRFARSLDFENLLQTVVEELGQLPLVKEASIHIAPPKEVLIDDKANRSEDLTRP